MFAPNYASNANDCCDTPQTGLNAQREWLVCASPKSLASVPASSSTETA